MSGQELDRDPGRAQRFDVSLRRLGTTRIGVDLETAAAAKGAGRGVPRRQLLGEVDPGAGRAVDPERRLGRLRRDAVDPVQDLPAVAAARAVTELAGFQQRDAEAGRATAQVPRRRDSGEAASHDRDVGDDPAAQRRRWDAAASLSATQTERFSSKPCPDPRLWSLTPPNPYPESRLLHL